MGKTLEENIAKLEEKLKVRKPTEKEMENDPELGVSYFGSRDYARIQLENIRREAKWYQLGLKIKISRILRYSHERL